MDNKEDMKSGIRCMVFLYSPLMANIKFFGMPTSFYVCISNSSNYFNYFYFGINALLEALISSLPLSILSILCYKEAGGNIALQIYYMQSVVLSLLTFVSNFIVGLVLIVYGI
jgi:hypothetical protein